MTDDELTAYITARVSVAMKKIEREDRKTTAIILAPIIIASLIALYFLLFVWGCTSTPIPCPPCRDTVTVRDTIPMTTFYLSPSVAQLRTDEFVDTNAETGMHTWYIATVDTVVENASLFVRYISPIPLRPDGLIEVQIAKGAR